MKLYDILKYEHINTDLKSRDKKSVLEELVIPIAETKGLKKEKLLEVLLEREALGSTGIGDKIAIPHGKLEDLDSIVLAFGKSKKGIPYEALDRRDVHLFFLILCPLTATALHLQALARISKILKNPELKNALLKADKNESVIEVIALADKES